MEPIRPFDMLLTLDGDGPRYAQITRALRSAIQDELLPPALRLPPTRDFARSLGCSRNIVLLAYEQLVLEGYLSTRQGAGTFVSPDLPTANTRQRAAPQAPGPLRLSQRGRTSVTAAASARGGDGPRAPRSPSISCTGSANPTRVSSRTCARRSTRALRARAFRYGPPAGDPGLRQQIADRIRAARGIARTAARHRGDERHPAGAGHLRAAAARSWRSRRGGRSGLCVGAGGLQRGRREARPRPGR